MIRYIFIFMFLIAFTVASCNSAKEKNAREDSLAASAAADSMLNEALKADSLNKDSL